jgi:hypothetical protein
MHFTSFFSTCLVPLCLPGYFIYYNAYQSSSSQAIIQMDEQSSQQQHASMGTVENKAKFCREIPIEPPPNVIADLIGIDAIPIPTPPLPKPAAIASQAHVHVEAKGISPHPVPFRQDKCSSLLGSYHSRGLNIDSSLQLFQAPTPPAR